MGMREDIKKAWNQRQTERRQTIALNKLFDGHAKWMEKRKSTSDRRKN